MKVKNLLKKTACAALSVSIAFSYMPLSSYAMSNSSKRVTDSEVIPIDSIEPGQVFTTGTYEIQRDIEVTQNTPGGNGIEIQGKVKFILNNHTVKVTAGDAKGITGGGAGVYVPKGNIFILDGEGAFDVKGGDGAKGEDGEMGGDADHFGHAWPNADEIKDGDGGKGGDGGGGAGAAIGTPGGNGGAGGDTTKGYCHRMSWWTSYHIDGTNGKNGKPGCASLNAGDIAVGKDVKLEVTAGKCPEKVGHGGGYGKDLTYKDNWRNYHTCTGGSGGGAGGSGFSAAEIGTGGSGGGGGGAGATGAFDSAVFSRDIFKVNGGGGGAGQGGSEDFVATGGIVEVNASDLLDPGWSGGNSCRMHGGPGGKGAQRKSTVFFRLRGGQGGDGGGATASGDGGTLYCDYLVKNTHSSLKSKCDKEGKAASVIKTIKQSDCEVKYCKIPQGNAYPYTGKEVKPKIEVVDRRNKNVISSYAYETNYKNNIEVGEATVEISGKRHNQEGVPTIVDDIYLCELGKLEDFFTIKYLLRIEGLKVKDKKYDGKRVKPVGKAKFVRVDDPTQRVEVKIPVVVRYYDSKGRLLKKAPKKVGKYKYDIVVDPNMKQYTGFAKRGNFAIKKEE